MDNLGENVKFEASHVIKLGSIERKNAIEEIAWQVFLNRLGLSFKRELTDEEKKSITDDESYEYYRQEAEKIYEKKQRAVLNKKYPIIDIPADGRAKWYGGAYCLCFVYSKHNGNFVLRGYIREVEEYLKKNYTHYFCNKSLWYAGQNRDIWSFWKSNVGISLPSIRERKKGKKVQVWAYRSWFDEDSTKEEREEMTFKFRRMPKRWISEFDKF
jgi:hypothetical protein